MKETYIKELKPGLSEIEVKSFLEKNNIEYKILSFDNSKNSFLGDYITNNDYVLMFIYGEQKKEIITIYHSAYIIFNSDGIERDIIFKENYLGP